MSNPQKSVAVCGAGIVGMSAALSLQRAGHKIALFDLGSIADGNANANDSEDLRVYALSPHSIALLSELNVWQKIQHAAVYSRMRVWSEDYAQSLVFDGESAGRTDLGAIVRHSELVNALGAQLQKNTGDTLSLHEHHAVNGLRQDKEIVEVNFASVTKAFDFVIGADGAHSSVRKFAGISATQKPFDQRGIVCNVRASKAQQKTAYQRFISSGPLAFLPLEKSGEFSIVWSTTEYADLLAASESDFEKALTEASQHQLGDISLLSKRVSFPLSRMRCEQWVSGNVILTGDAAHVIHPLAGQGLNLGLEDVEALTKAFKKPAKRSLARYQRERIAHVHDMEMLTTALNGMFSEASPVLRDFSGKGMNATGKIAPLRDWLMRKACGY